MRVEDERRKKIPGFPTEFLIVQKIGGEVIWP